MNLLIKKNVERVVLYGLHHRKNVDLFFMKIEILIITLYLNFTVDDKENDRKGPFWRRLTQ